MRERQLRKISSNQHNSQAIDRARWIRGVHWRAYDCALRSECARLSATTKHRSEDQKHREPEIADCRKHGPDCIKYVRDPSAYRSCESTRSSPALYDRLSDLQWLPQWRIVVLHEEVPKA